MTNESFYKLISPLERGIVDFYGKHRGLLVIENAKEILEIGSGWGIFTRSVLMANESCVISTIDKIPDPKSFADNTQGFEDRIKRFVGDSKVVLKGFPSDSMDVVFVDGDHGYDGVKADLAQAFRIVKDGGYIIADDVHHKFHMVEDKGYGIFQALSEFCLEKKLCLEVFPVAHGIGIIKIKK